MDYKTTITFCVSKQVLKNLQQKSKTKSLDEYINTLIMKDIDRLT